MPYLIYEGSSPQVAKIKFIYPNWNLDFPDIRACKLASPWFSQGFCCCTAE